MFNCVAVKKWKRSVAWFPSYGVKCIADVECRKRNVKRQLESWENQLGKIVVGNEGAYIVSMDRKTTFIS